VEISKQKRKEKEEKSEFKEERLCQRSIYFETYLCYFIV